MQTVLAPNQTALGALKKDTELNFRLSSVVKKKFRELCEKKKTKMADHLRSFIESEVNKYEAESQSE